LPGVLSAAKLRAISGLGWLNFLSVRGPPGRDDDLEPMPDWDLIAQLDLGFEFDQRPLITAVS
jgi:hypothetical protein